MHAPIKTRVAPSPTGLIHLGNARTALFNALLALRHGGVFLLRIEDTDLERSREEYIHALVEDMRWLGLDWHGLRLSLSQAEDVKKQQGHAIRTAVGSEEYFNMRPFGEDKDVRINRQDLAHIIEARVEETFNLG